MILRDFIKVYVYEYSIKNDYGEMTKEWKYKGTDYLNMQQDINELDRKSTGEVDYEIYKGRTDKNTIIEKGNGISLEIADKPKYKVLTKNKIGNCTTLRMEKIQ